MKQEKFVLFFLLTRLLFVACCIFLVCAHYSHGVEKLVNNSYPPFIMAAFSSRFEEMKQLYEREYIKIDTKGFDGTTALHNVCKNGGFPGSLDALRYLIDNGAYVREGDNEGLEPIHYVIQVVDIIKRDVFIEELIKSGADLRAVTGVVEAVVGDKTSKMRFTVPELVVSNFDFVGIKDLVIVWGVLLGKQLIEKASHYARSIGLREMADMIDESSVTDLPTGRFHGMTKLMVAILQDDKKLIGTLLKKPSALLKVSRDRYKQTPLHIATRHGKIESMKQLIEAGADSRSKDYLGNTALHIAARHGDKAFRMACLELLASQRGSLLREKNHNGDTPLHTAAILGNEDFVARAITSYPQLIDLRIRNNKGLSVENIATRYQLKAIQEVLGEQ